mgnify:CR=1 FL=1|jgi:hypothetical protein
MSQPPIKPPTIEQLRKIASRPEGVKRLHALSEKLQADRGAHLAELEQWRREFEQCAAEVQALVAIIDQCVRDILEVTREVQA